MEPQSHHEYPTPPLPFSGINTERRSWHYAYFHESKDDLVNSICRFLVPAMQPKHAAIIVATKEHIASVMSCGSEYGIDLASAREKGQLVILDAEELLARFMVNGTPDPVRFQLVVGGLMKEVAANYPYLHVYGEMVALLWEKGNEDATHKLEALWNDLARFRPFALLCGYPKQSFNGKGVAYQHICEAHDHSRA